MSSTSILESNFTTTTTTTTTTSLNVLDGVHPSLFYYILLPEFDIVASVCIVIFHAVMRRH